MKFRAAGIVAVALLLCGCGDADWDNLLSFDRSASDASADQVAPADMPTTSANEPTTPPPANDVATVAQQPSYSVTQTVTTATPVVRNATNGYCRELARSSGADATRDGMDSAAQQHAADATYRECEAFYGK
jgi:hypothetical protein